MSRTQLIKFLKLLVFSTLTAIYESVVMTVIWEVWHDLDLNIYLSITIILFAVGCGIRAVFLLIRLAEHLAKDQK